MLRVPGASQRESDECDTDSGTYAYRRPSPSEDRGTIIGRPDRGTHGSQDGGSIICVANGPADDQSDGSVFTANIHSDGV